MDIRSQEKKYIAQVYRRYDLTLVKGKGKYVWDDKGKRYLDFFSGISVCNMGHCNPRVVAAVKKQAETLMHASNLYYAEPQVNAARELIKLSFPGRVFLSNSGAEANECALKISRKWGKLFKNKKGEDRFEVITFQQSFHGRTFATLTATGQEKLHKGFEPMLPGFRYAKYNDLASVKELVNDKTVAIMVEPIQGEGGVMPATKEFLKGLRELCDRENLLLIFDEIQTGLGRTGRAFAWKNYGVKPDVVTLAKSLAGGLPLGATVYAKKAEPVFTFGEHGSTFGGNLVSCAAATEVLRMLTPQLLKDVTETGKYFVAKLNGLKKKYPFIKEVRGMGLMLGVVLDMPGRDIVRCCQEKGLLINCVQDTVLRFLPPLIITKSDVDTSIKILEEAFRCQTSKKS